MRLIQVARSLLVAVSPPVLPMLGGKEAVGVSASECCSPQPPQHLHLQFFRLVCFSIFLDQWRSITSNRFVFNMVWGHHLQLRYCYPLFSNFWQFNVKVIVAHQPIIQKEVDELLAEGVIEPSSDGAGFYCSMFVVPKHTGGLWPILNLKHFNCYMHVLLDMSGSLFSMVIMLSPVTYRMLIYIPVIKHHHHFLQFFLAQCTLSEESFAFWVGLTKPILFLCHCKGFCIVIYLDDILVLVCSKGAGKRAASFLCSLLVRCGLHINFLSLTFPSLRLLISWGYGGILSTCHYLYLLISYLILSS